MFAIRGRSATQARKRSTLPSTQKENSQKDSSTSTNNVENSIIFCDNIQPGALATSELKEDIPMHNEDRGQQRCANQGKGLPTNLVQVGATHKEGVSFLNGAKDITITGNPSFNGYYHQYHHHHHHHHYYYPPSSLRYNPISGVTFVDLTGKEYSVSADHAVSRELFCKTIRLFFHGNIFEAYFQREEMEWGSYELIVVHQGTEIIKLDDKVWQSSFEVGMKVVMFPTFTAYQRYQCPHCHTWLVIDPELTAVVCGVTLILNQLKTTRDGSFLATPGNGLLKIKFVAPSRGK
ncbi:hypothetical protein CPB83DRAFT_895686 [Crepidotus variabilis]|uniref:Ubiquitin-like domain-containing protein n=1 Tax=Crepidotus variabilis TaxID=179855 RepID=A0A9P6EDF4_9AGAR|nr:hypothetical protein CPB83DRAFT_895686 [Crepidotus variabilis]